MAESLRVGSVGELQLDLVWQLGDVPAMASWAPMSQQAAWHLHTLMPEEEPAFAFLQVPPLAAAASARAHLVRVRRRACLVAVQGLGGSLCSDQCRGTKYAGPTTFSYLAEYGVYIIVTI